MQLRKSRYTDASHLHAVQSTFIASFGESRDRMPTPCNDFLIRFSLSLYSPSSITLSPFLIGLFISYYSLSLGAVRMIKNEMMTLPTAKEPTAGDLVIPRRIRGRAISRAFSASPLMTWLGLLIAQPWQSTLLRPFWEASEVFAESHAILGQLSSINLPQLNKVAEKFDKVRRGPSEIHISLENLQDLLAYWRIEEWHKT